MILVFGTLCLDRVRQVPFLPPVGGYVGVTSEQEVLGGEAANTAFALLKWGVRFGFYPNAIGNDLSGQHVNRLAKAKGLPALERMGPLWKTPVCDIYVTPDGERTMFGVGFTELGESVDPADVPLPSSGWVTVDMNLGDAGRQVVARAECACYVMDLPEPVVKPGDVWQGSTDWLGVRGNESANRALVAERVEAWGCAVILSDGANGLIAGSPTLPARAFPAFPCPSLVDSTGSGDLFRAAMLYGLDHGWAFNDCLRFATAAGALGCQYLGASERIPTVAEIDRHIQDNPAVASAYDLDPTP